jgi:hypothetical protein
MYSDEHGFYKAELPMGEYTMTAGSPKIKFDHYSRPLFQLSSPGDVKIDIYFDLQSAYSCEMGVPSLGAPLDLEEAKDSCGGSDSFSIPSTVGIPFELYIRYRTRHRNSDNLTYSGGEGKSTVFVAYNLFTLIADQATYNVKTRELSATGHAAVYNARGEEMDAKSLMFKIEDGRATVLPNP